MKPGLTLNRVFLLSLLGLMIALGLLFWLVFHNLEKALTTSAREASNRDSAIIGDSVTGYLTEARDVEENFEKLLNAGFTKPSDLKSLRDGLFAVLLENNNISEATFTFAKRTGFDKNGDPITDPATAGQVTLFRARQRAGFVHRTTWYQDGHFLSTRAHVDPDGQEPTPEAPIPATNPTAHYTFTTPAGQGYEDQLLWTDLHWSELDAALPVERRRVEVSVLKPINYPKNNFAGVLRIGLFTDAINRAIEMPESVDVRTHSIFLCDNQGRLIALSGSDYIVSDDDVRLSPRTAPRQVLDALRLPSLAAIGGTNELITDQFVTSGTTFLCTFRAIPETRDWIVGVAVPSNAYLGDLLIIKRRVVTGSLILGVAIAIFGGIVLRGVSVAHSIIVREAGRMNDFVLDPSHNTSRLRDIDHVLSSLERAKTAMRSMGKYVPLDLVRRLYHRGEEPGLGGEATELSVLFTDIKSFTEFAESHDGDIVAARLGDYMHVVATVIQRERGTIDKFIGDSVMTFWNAPEPVPGHAAFACRAALGCREALAALYDSNDWRGFQRFETRFGLHHGIASVGHFGSPERFNYTAIGDGINLASRLESLNKYYGTTIIASGAMREAAGGDFVWRRLDRVSVKGKTEGIDIHELLGLAGAPVPGTIARYEQALVHWFDGNFDAALAIAATQLSDPPSAYLAARCRVFIETPPAGWSGIYTFESK